MEELSALLSAPVIKRSVMIAGHATSVSIEKPFWDTLKAQAKAQRKSINQLITEIDDARPQDVQGNLSSAIRLYVLGCLKQPL
ncbi:MAG TPA: ribbon-helix-helix domain-containing protein [Alphaproteobacteria bacterium]|nr:ribbon-helix-helix domain-containing protein [Alphaproteobacteria bacterium]